MSSRRSKTPGRDRFVEIDVGRRDHADVRLDGMRATGVLEFALLRPPMNFDGPDPLTRPDRATPRGTWVAKLHTTSHEIRRQSEY
jgi:hypothetical protein